MTDKLKDIIWERCPLCLEEYPKHQLEQHNGICGNCDTAKEKARKSESEKLSQDIKIKRGVKENNKIFTGDKKRVDQFGKD